MFNYRELLLIGTGSIAHRHFLNISSLNANVKCYCLSRSGRTIDGCESYSNVQTTQFDVVVIASATDKHDSDMYFAISVIKSGGIIFIEKPISLDIEESNKIEILISQKNIRVVVGYDLRYDKGVSHLKKVFDEEIAEKNNFIYNSKVGQNLKTWRVSEGSYVSYSYSQEKSGGIINDLSHEIDLATYITGVQESFSVRNYKSQIINSTLNDLSKLELVIKRNDELKKLFISIDCISHRFYRYIDIQTKEKNYFLDLLSGYYKEFAFGSTIQEIKFQNDRNERNQKMWSEIFSCSSTKLPSYHDSLKMIKQIV